MKRQGFVSILPHSINHDYLQKKWTLQRADFSVTWKSYELKLSFQIPHGLYYIEEQYYLHDLNSFIADVGGYLGLLLGHSALGIFSMLMEYWFIKRKGRRILHIWNSLKHLIQICLLHTLYLEFMCSTMQLNNTFFIVLNFCIVQKALIKSISIILNS